MNLSVEYLTCRKQPGKPMKPLFIFSILICLSLTGTTCKEPSPTQTCTDCSVDTTGTDTTTGFTFTRYEFGGNAGSCYFNDCKIWSETNIWATGYVDSNGLALPVNIMKWDGKKWKGIGPFFNSFGVNGIWGLDSNHVYLADGLVIKYVNGVFTRIDFTHLKFGNGQSVQKLWGSSESNIWGVGSKGMVVHYDGVKWYVVNIDSLTGKSLGKVDFTGIHGVDENHFWMVGYDSQNGSLSILIEFRKGVWSFPYYDDPSDDGNIWEVTDAMWIPEKDKYWVVTKYLFELNKNKFSTIITFPDPTYVDGIKNIDNGIMIWGNWGELGYYQNGEWTKYRLPAHFYGGDFKNKMMITVGLDGNKAIIYLGKRK